MLKVAFATRSRVRVDQHFGASEGFAIYALDGERARLVEVAEFSRESMDGNEDNAPAAAGGPERCNPNGWTPEGRHKLPAKIGALSACAAVYCLAVGGSAVRQLMAAGVQPIRLEEETPIDKLLAELQRSVREGGVPWIDKALRREKDAGRFDRMAEEGWNE